MPQAHSTTNRTEPMKTSAGSKQSCATGAEACATPTPYCCTTLGSNSQPDGGGECVATFGECESGLFACREVAQCPSDTGIIPVGCGEEEAKKCTSAEPCTCVTKFAHGDNGPSDASPHAAARKPDVSHRNPSELCADDPDHNFSACTKACTDPNEPDYDACQLVCKKDNSKCVKGCERDGNFCRIACENGSETSCMDGCAAFLLTQSEMAMQNPCEGMKLKSVTPRMIYILKRELAAACKESRRTQSMSPMRGFSIMLSNAKRNLPPSTIKTLNAEANACLGR
jgi:hypothetical protein